MSEQRPLFSVIMPSYKLARAYVERAIDSVLSQDYPSWELVYVDDNPAGSPWKDVSRQLASEHADDPRMRFIFHEDNLGANRARNDAIAAARGEWLAFLDADDYWDACYLRNVAEKIAGVADGADVGAATDGAAGPIALVSTPVRFHNGCGVRELPFSHADGMVYEEEILGDIFSSSSGICVRRDVLLEAGGFDVALPARQDYDMWLRVCKRHPVAFCDEVAVTVVQDGHESISTSYERHLKGTLAVLEKILADEDLSSDQRRSAEASQCLYLGTFLVKRGQGRLARKYLRRARAAGASGASTAKLTAASYVAPVVPYVRLAVNRVRYR